MPRSNSPKSQVQVIARAAAVLRALEKEPAGLSLGSIARRVGLPRSTVQRIVGALEAESLVIAASPLGRVRLGPALLRLSAAVESTVTRIAKPHMLALARDLSETIDLSVMARDHLIIIEQTVGGRRDYSVAAVAVQFPLHCTANGKAMLALLEDADIEQRLGSTFDKRTEHTLTTLPALLQNLRAVRRSGVAYGMEENAAGVCAIGVAFRDMHDNILSLSVPIPAPRFEANRSRVAQRLLETRAVLEGQLRMR